MIRKALVVVDVQNDFCEGGSLPVTGGLAVAKGIAKLVRSGKYSVVVGTLDYHHRLGDNGGHFAETPDYKDTWPTHCVQGSTGAGFAPGVDAEMFEEIFTKGNGEAAYSGFQGKGVVTGKSLRDFLRDKGVTEVDVVGLAFDYCVRATAIDAADFVDGTTFDTRVLKDHTASVNPDFDAAVTAVLNDAGVVVA